MKAFINLSAKTIELSGEADEIAKVLIGTGISDYDSKDDNLFKTTTIKPDVEDMRNSGDV